MLKARFKRYLSSSDNKWDKTFDARTTFLDDFLALGPHWLAKRLTETDYNLYRELDVHSLQGRQALQTLKQREKNLSRSVRECLDVRVLNEDRLFELAQVVSRLKLGCDQC